jgi:hypothetical protein
VSALVLAHQLFLRTYLIRAELRDGGLDRIEQATAGARTHRLDGLAASSGAVSNPTAGAAGHVDRARADLVELEAALDAAWQWLGRAWEICAQYPPAHGATPAERAELARLNGRAEPCCESCARVRRPDGGRRWEPIDARLAEATTVDGRLGAPALLCRWCYDRVRSWGRLPTLDEITRHHRGERVPWPADVERPA